MQFDSFFQAQSTLLWSVFVIALLLGAVVNKTNFCTMGAVSDWVNMGDSGRMRAWLFAIAVAVLGVSLLEYFGMLNLASTFPPYRASNLVFAENIIGGLLFGIGMTLASGCGNKCLIRIGGGNIKSIFVFLIIGVVAYFMLNPFPGTDKTLFSVLFYPWIRPMSADLGTQQDIGAILAGEHAHMARLAVGLVAAAALLLFVFKSADFRRSRNNILGGLVVGLAVLGAWYITANIVVHSDDGNLSLNGYYSQWDFLADSDAGKPADGAPLSTQSFTFISPMAQTVEYLSNGLDSAYVTFGVMAVAGVILGSLLWALLSRSFRLEWFASGKDFFNHVIGAVLMGVGGTLAMGCTIGQAVSGVSTMAVGSILAFAAIVLGSALTMKVQLYRMVYEDQASFGKALVTGLVDLRLLPKGLRKLEAV